MLGLRDAAVAARLKALGFVGYLPKPLRQSQLRDCLALVLGLFFLVVWALRRASPNSSATLPGEVLETLGRAPLANRQQVLMLRCLQHPR